MTDTITIMFLLSLIGFFWTFASTRYFKTYKT